MTIENLIAKLRDSYNLSLKRKNPVVRLSIKLYKEHQSKRIDKAKKLADKIYKLSNIDRIIDSQAYIQAIEIETLNEISEDNQFILQYAKDYFKTTYELDLKKKGESPELIDQILKRTGKATKEKFEEVLRGFDVHALCEKIWSGDLNNNPSLVEELLSLNDFQINQLLIEFKILPARKLARFFYKCINSNPLDIDSIRLIFQNKNEAEISNIIEVLEEEFLFKEGQEQVLFRGWLKSKLTQIQFEEINRLLLGLNLDELADRISKIFINPNLYLEKLAKILSTRFGDIYNTNYYYNNPRELELIIAPFTNSLIYYLPKEEFLNLKKILYEKHEIEISDELYTFFWNKSLTDTIFNFEKSIANYNANNQDVSLFEYLKAVTGISNDDYYQNVLTHLFPLLAISPYNKFHIEKLYLSLIGKNLFDTISNFSNSVKNKRDNLTNLIEIISNGYANINLNLELQDFLKSNDLITNKHSNLVDEFNKFLNSTKSISESSDNILSFLSKLSQDQLLGLIMLYPMDNQSFLDVLSKKTSPSLLIKLKNILNGFKPKDLINKLDGSSSLFNFSPLEVALLSKEYQQSKNLDLGSLFEKNISKIPLYYHNSIHLKNSIINQKCFETKEISDFISKYKEDFYQANFIELAYNHLFSTRELCHESSFGNLRFALQIQKNYNFLTIEDCIKIMSILDFLPINLIFDIYKLANNKEKDLETAKILHGIFRQYQDKLENIETLYYILDREKSLRQRIYDFSLIPTDSSLTLLLLDGYDPEKIIYQIRDYVSKYSGEELGEKICSLLDETNLKIIPTDKNWKGEFYHQVRIRYKLITGDELVELLKSKKVPTKGLGLNLLCYLFYGEMSKQAIDFRKIIKKSENAENDLYAIFRNLKLAELERAIDMYENYYTAIIEDEIASIKRDEKINAALLKKAKDAKQWEDDYFKNK